MICPQCGTENLAGADSCSSCESALSDLDLPHGKDDLGRQMLEAPIAELNPPVPFSLGPNDSVDKAVKLMVEKQVGCVLVKERDALVGIFTERDALQKCATQDIDLEKINLRDYMTPQPETLESGHCLAAALNKMSVGGYRHIPIIKANQVEGIISIRDILKYFWS